MTEQEFIDSAVRDHAARVMLAALIRHQDVCGRDGDMIRAAIAQAEAAGIKGED